MTADTMTAADVALFSTLDRMARRERRRQRAAAAARERFPDTLARLNKRAAAAAGRAAQRAARESFKKMI